MSYSAKAIQVGKNIDQIRVNHLAFKETLEGIGRVIQLGNSLQHPFGACVIAPAGAGKSLLIDSIKRNVYNWPFLRPHSVLVGSLKETPTVGQVQEDLLADFNYAIPPRAGAKNNAALFDMLVRAIEQHDIQLIALDEYQHVFRADKGGVAHSGINDWVKRLMTKTCRPVVLVGTELLDNFEHADSQVTTRVSSIFRLPVFSNDENWRGVIASYVAAAKDVDLSELAAHANLLFKATQGVMRTLKALIMEVAMIAVDANDTKVERKHLRLAFQRLVGPASTRDNPFA